MLDVNAVKSALSMTFGPVTVPGCRFGCNMAAVRYPNENDTCTMDVVTKQHVSIIQYTLTLKLYPIFVELQPATLSDFPTTKHEVSQHDRDIRKCVESREDHFEEISPVHVCLFVNCGRVNKRETNEPYAPHYASVAPTHVTVG